MEELLSAIIKLSEQKRLFPAEQIITSTLSKFEYIIPPEINNSSLEKIELALLKLLYVNDGCLSQQCCGRIANCLLVLYKSTSPPQVWNLIVTVTSRPSVASIFTTGYIINSIGSNIKSKIPGLAQKLLTLDGDLLLPSIYSLTHCFKRNRKDMILYVKKGFKFGTKALNTNIEANQLFGLRLIRTLLKFKKLSMKALTSVITSLLERNVSSFVTEESSLLIAKCAYFLYFETEKSEMSMINTNSHNIVANSNSNNFNTNNINTNNINSNNINNNNLNNNNINSNDINNNNINDNNTENINAENINANNINASNAGNTNNANNNAKTNYSNKDVMKSDFKSNDMDANNENNMNNYKINGNDTEQLDFTEQLNQSFQMFESFKKYFHQILKHFLDILNPVVVYSNLPTIFKNIRRINSSELFQLISLFGSEAKSELFQQIIEERPPTPDQLSILIALQNDEASQKEIAALALQLCQSPNTAIRSAGAQSFAKLVETNPAHAKLYLETAMLYLALPPEDNPKIETDIRAFGSIATYILGCSSNRDEMANSIASHATTFLDKSFEKMSIFDPTFIESFSIMTVLPPYLVPHTFAVSGVSIFSNYIMSHTEISELNIQRLRIVAQTIALFLTAHSGCEGFLRFFKTVLDAPYLHTQTIMLAFLIEAPKSIPESPKLYDMLMAMHPFFFKATPDLEHLKARLKNPMISSNDLLNNTSSVKPKSTILFAKLPPSLFADRVIENYSKYAEVMPKGSIAKILPDLLKQTTNLNMIHSLIHALCLNEEIRKKLTPNFCSSLISNLLISSQQSSKDFLRQQTTAECVALYAQEYPKSTANILKDIENITGPPKCFLFSALFSFAKLNTEQLTAMMHELDSLVLKASISSFALHSLAVLFKTHSVDLSAMRANDIQCQVLLNLLNSSITLRPLNLYSTAYCFISILTAISPEMANGKSDIVPMLQLIVQAFNQIHMPYSKLIYFHMIRAVFAFSKGSIVIPALTFPRSRGKSMALKIAACGTFTDYINSTENYEDMFYLIPTNLLLLQRSKNKKVMDFIVAIATKFARNCEPSSERDRIRTTEWIKIYTSVISNSVLPETGIESAPIVKKCCLQTAVYIVDVLAKSKPLMTENLDDLITAITRSIETRSGLLLGDAYDLLALVIANFANVISDEGNRLLLLYDSQFSIAVRSGFEIDLLYSGKFLIEYLHFHMEDLKTRSEDFEAVLSSYVKGLQTCTQRTFAYFAVAAHIICIARENKCIFELIKEYAKTIVTQLCEVVSISMALWRSHPPDWQQISQFRLNYSSFYREIVVAFIWLQEVNQQEYINIEKFISFEIEELETCTESWRVLTAFDALNTLFIASPQKIVQDQISKTIESLNIANKRCNNLFSASLDNFLKICNLISSSEKTGGITSEQIIALSANSKFDAVATAELIHNSNDLSANIFTGLAERIFAGFVSKHLNSKEFLALTTLLLEKVPTNLNIFLNLFINNYKSIDDQTNLGCLTRYLRRVVNDDDILPYFDQISTFVWSRFKIGGIFVISQVLIENPKIGIKLFLFNNLKTLSFLIESDILNCLVYLQFLTMGVTVFIENSGNIESDNNNNNNIANVLRDSAAIAFRAVIKWGYDLRGEEIIRHAAFFLRDLSQKAPLAVRSAFDEIEVKKVRQIVQFTENELKKTEAKRNVKSLKTFSSKSRRAQNYDDEEWQTLECED